MESRYLYLSACMILFAISACDEKDVDPATDLGLDVIVSEDSGKNPNDAGGKKVSDMQSSDAQSADLSSDLGNPEYDLGDDAGVRPPGPLLTSVKNYIFGHSLIVHSPPAIATPSDETTVPHWMYLFAKDAGYQYSVSGQYGFLMQHDDLPPSAQWGFDIVPTAWDPDVSGESFSDVNFTTVLLTAGNFIQYKPATEPYDGNNPENATPISATMDIVSWVTNEEPGIKVYIYENWPDMAGYLSAGFPPTANDFSNYNTYVLGDFHTWWLDYHDALLNSVQTSNLDVEVKMIPVGPIIAKLLASSPLNNIPLTDLYEDDAPHGRPTLYFLAGLVTYMAIYGTTTPTDYEVPSIIHAEVRDNYSDIVQTIWTELNAFKDSSGTSRVF